MLEKDKNERKRLRIDNGGHIISDRFQHWTTDKKYELKVDYSSRRSGNGKIIEEHVTFSRFEYNDLENWIQHSARDLGFSVLLYRNGEIVNEVNEKNFIDTELIFSGKYDWKENINFKVNEKIDGRTVLLNNGFGEWVKLTRKPYAEVVVPERVWHDRHYDNMIADLVNM